MYVVSETEARTTTTPTGVMIALAAPSQGTRELSTWRVRTEAGSVGPLHAIDREQVWMPVTGRLEITAEEETAQVGAGQAVILPANVTRRIRTVEGPAEVLVCMPVGGVATVPGDDEPRELPWAR